MVSSVRSGFTLIELSIVLVIIGLIAGGALAGASLIHASKIRALASQIESYKTASNTFKLKFNCLPGDCPTATSYLSGTTNGNGNKQIGVIWSSDESLLFWQHLALAQLIPGSYSTVAPGAMYAADVNFPSVKLGGVIGVGYWGAYNAGGAVGSGWLFPAVYNNALLYGTPWMDTSSRIPLRGAISGPDALAIDTKFDDGLPAYGRIVTWQNQSGYSGGCSTTNVASTTAYTTSTNKLCSLFFISAF